MKSRPFSILRLARHVRNSRSGSALRPSCRRGYVLDAQTIQENDAVILRQNDRASATAYLQKLKADGRFHSAKGYIRHEEIIGKVVRDVVKTNLGIEYRVQLSTLAEYVTMAAGRRVTPIYPDDANLIVSLLDLHFSPPSSLPLHPPLEILEAGTGHGGLTIHLARALQAANGTAPSRPSLAPASLERAEEGESATAAAAATAHDKAEAYESYRRHRRAILHTLDLNPGNSSAAARLIASFRQGLYTPHIDFHVGDVSEWISSQLASRSTSSPTPGPFLTHAILDLPSSHTHLATVADALLPDGMLLVFNPSVSQIMRGLELAKTQKLGLWLEKVIELGGAVGTGGREWDVRAVRPRSWEKAGKGSAGGETGSASVAVSKEAAEEAEEAEAESVAEAEAEAEADGGTHISASSDYTEGYEVVCRPKVGHRVVGGGFLGVWRKMRR